MVMDVPNASPSRQAPHATGSHRPSPFIESVTAGLPDTKQKCDALRGGDSPPEEPDQLVRLVFRQRHVLYGKSHVEAR
jgi:hypothetical protein